MSRKPPQSPYFDTALTIINTLYGDLDARRISLNERKRLDLEEDCYVYGEINYNTFAMMLDIAKPQAGDVFYDLGSGAGKAVILAALLYDFSKAQGVEFLEPLHHLSQDQCQKLHQLIPNELTETDTDFSERQFNIDFTHGDLFAHDVSDANIVYINATCFMGEVWEKITKKLNDELPVGGHVLLTTKSLPSERYEQRYSELQEMSWGPCTVNIFRKTK